MITTHTRWCAFKTKYVPIKKMYVKIKINNKTACILVDFRSISKNKTKNETCWHFWSRWPNSYLQLRWDWLFWGNLCGQKGGTNVLAISTSQLQICLDTSMCLVQNLPPVRLFHHGVKSCNQRTPVIVRRITGRFGHQIMVTLKQLCWVVQALLGPSDWIPPHNLTTPW